MRQRICLILAVAMVASPFDVGAETGDVYVSYAPNGTASYASQPLDNSYTLLIAAPRTPEHSSPAAALESSRHRQLTPLIKRYARRHNLPADLVAAVIAVESRFNPGALSPKGAMGPMQLMPATAARFGVKDRKDPSQNIDAGVRYLKELLTNHQGNVALALAAYNAGEGAISRHRQRIPPYRETMLYVPAVLAKVAASQTDITSNGEKDEGI